MSSSFLAVELPEEVWKYILTFIQFTKLPVKQKTLVLVCHNWQNILDNLDYYPIPNPGTITLNLIDRYSQQFNWPHISTNYQLSEQFIIRYFSNLDIMYILISQNISETFIEQHFSQFSPYLLQLKELSEEFLERHIKDFDFVELVMTQPLSPRFIRKYYGDCQDKNMCELLKNHQNLPSDVENKFLKILKLDNYTVNTCKYIILTITILSLSIICIILFYIGLTHGNIVALITGAIIVALVCFVCILVIKN